MKDLGIVTLISVAAIAAAPASDANRPTNGAKLATSAFATTKSTEAFADCFARTQDRHSRPWWFVPKGNGGTFSNLGAKAVSKPYFLVINDSGSRRDIELQNANHNGPEARGVEQCI